MRKIRILLVSPFPPPFGGIASYSENLYQGLLKAGLEVKRYNTARFEKFRFHDKDNTYSYLRIFNPRNFLLYFSFLVDWIFYFITVFNYKPDIVHVHTASFISWWRSTIYIMTAKAFRVKTILHIHNAIDRFYFQESGKIGRFFIRRSLAIPTHLITLSAGIRRRISGLTLRPNTSIYNGVDCETYRNGKEYKYPIKILFAGFVGREKGVPDLLKGLHKSELSSNTVMLTVMGKGEIEEMKILATNLGLTNQVCFTGRVSEDKKISLFKSHHILALPSYGEGQPISILEGMAAGMAILSTLVGSIPEIVMDSVNGYLVKPGDTVGLAQALKKLSNNSIVEKFGIANSIKAYPKYDFTRVVKDNIHIYQKAVNV